MRFQIDGRFKRPNNRALNISIKRARDQTDLNSPQLLNALEFCRHGLSLFTEIDPQDREAVAYFNQFQSAKAVPEHRKSECLQLIMKYLKRSTSDSSGTLEQEDIGFSTL
jgi:hypothetical protein